MISLANSSLVFFLVCVLKLGHGLERIGDDVGASVSCDCYHSQLFNVKLGGNNCAPERQVRAD